MKFLLMMIFSISAFASEYDYRAKHELTCESVQESELKLTITVQQEMFVNWSGWLHDQRVIAVVKVKGPIDKDIVDFTYKYNVEVMEKGERTKKIVGDAEYFAQDKKKVRITSQLLSSLANDETIPGRSLKIVNRGSKSGYAGDDTLHLIHNNKTGFASLNVDDEHFETVQVNCREVYDTADWDQDYIKEFSKI